jgi:agmatinase
MLLHTSNTFVPYNTDLKDADVVFIGVPFVSGSISKQALYGPVIVRESLKLKEGFPDKKICDVGDLFVVPGSFDLTSKRIKETINEIKDANEKSFLIFIGGDHSITLPITEAIKPKTIIQLDAHSDTRKDYLGNKYMQQTWAYHASKFAKIIQIGLNAINNEEKEELAKNKNIISMSINEFLEKTPRMEGPIHLTVDIDVFDPSYVVTGLYEGKAKKEEIMKIIGKIRPDSIDIVEIADDKLPSKTGFLAAEIISRILKSD